MSDSKELAATTGDTEFSLVQRKAKLYTSSELVPKIYQGNTPSALANTVIALNLAHRIGADELMVMQNLYVIQGRPSWSSTFIISALNSCGRFSPIRFVMSSLGQIETNGRKIDNRECKAVCREVESGETLEGPPVSMSMAIAEGWYGKSGSKWLTMPELMLRYRAASFFGRLYAPEILNGLQTVEESEDIGMRDVTPTRPPEDVVKLAPDALPVAVTDSPKLADIKLALIDYGDAEGTAEKIKKAIDKAMKETPDDAVILGALLAKVKAACDK
jgi:hypothetical protein